MDGITERVLHPGHRGPLLVQSLSSERDLADLVSAQGPAIEERLFEHGAVLFRGFRAGHSEHFERFVGALGRPRMDYVYGSTPRTRVGDRIFTATEYPPPLQIPLHSECSYQRQWPLKIAFCCVQPSATGGQTPLADLRRVGAAIGSSMMSEFRERGVRYVRNYHPHVDVPWQTVFQTREPDAVTQFCAANSIVAEWLENDRLRTTQVCQGTAAHPVSGEHVFFNQAHLFHVSSLAGDGASVALKLFGPDGLPRQTYFGDGAEIPTRTLDAVRAAFAAEATQFSWQAGDILLIDNMQVAHGRRAFTGARKVLAALLEPCSAVPRSTG